ncbi:MAG: hypothetical protein KDA92_20480 [Planctomycetales bacterium]|nr:hypothetical protein [Planctomycetales bacterium]
MSDGLTAIVLASAPADSTALISFVIYLIAVFALALLSSRGASESGFISEYFLGGRNLGVWAFALTFAATSASGGSFVGFPALIYTHGWSLALWISGYMMVPIVAMGLLGKRLNQVSRLAEGITIPDVIERRFGSAAAGLVATLLIVSFMFYFLLGQFQAGSKILGTLLRGVPAFDRAVQVVADLTQRGSWLDGTDPEYVLCLFFFSAAVIVYVVYGGFRAVVWTDVMQGIIMFFGVIVLLSLAIYQCGGLQQATEQLAARRPPRFGTATLTWQGAGELEQAIPKGTWIATQDAHWVRVAQRTQVPLGAQQVSSVEILTLTNPGDEQAVPADSVSPNWLATVESLRPYAFGQDRPHVYLYPPGPHPQQANGYLPVALAISFFFFWPFGAAGQPSNMVRLMAFRNTQILRLSIVTVSVYFTIVYFSLVVIFCCARVLMPGMEIDADRVMPEMAVMSTRQSGVPWLAGFLLAAPFAAVMSSVDSFLLLVSSSIVRDIFQRHLAPHAHESTLKRVTYLGTLIVGIYATYCALRPPPYLQEIIVDASGFLSASFLVPVTLSLYWRRMNGTGAIAGMLAGCLVHAMFSYHPVFLKPVWQTIESVGLGPLMWDLSASGLATIGGTLLTKPLPAKLTQKYFVDA